MRSYWNFPLFVLGIFLGCRRIEQSLVFARFSTLVAAIRLNYLWMADLSWKMIFLKTYLLAKQIQCCLAQFATLSQFSASGAIFFFPPDIIKSPAIFSWLLQPATSSCTMVVHLAHVHCSNSFPGASWGDDSIPGGLRGTCGSFAPRRESWKCRTRTH